MEYGYERDNLAMQKVGECCEVARNVRESKLGAGWVGMRRKEARRKASGWLGGASKVGEDSKEGGDG